MMGLHHDLLEHPYPYDLGLRLARVRMFPFSQGWLSVVLRSDHPQRPIQ